MSKIVTLSERPSEERAVTAQTEVFLRAIQQVLKAKGFKRVDARNRSAMFEWTFQRDDRILNLNGWHGTGQRGTCRWFGDLKAILSLYDNAAYLGTDKARWKRDKKFDLDVIDGTVEQHTKLLHDVTLYIGKI